MADDRPENYSLLAEIARSADVSAVGGALNRARIPYQSGLLAGSPPRVMIYVPESRLDDARVAVSHFIRHDFPPEPESETFEGPVVERDHPFPWDEIRTVLGMVLAHLGLVFWVRGPWSPGPEPFRLGGLISGHTLDEPWRLVTSLFLHSGPAHALWNGLSMLVFAVPLLSRLHLLRTAVIYLVSGVGGGIAAVAVAEPGAVIVGSSGAVAGLFGAWVVLTLRDARSSVLSWRARVRTLGVALLFLPSLLNPTTSSGQPVSVSSHLGGLATGMVIGALLSSRMAVRREPTSGSTRD